MPLVEVHAAEREAKASLQAAARCRACTWGRPNSISTPQPEMGEDSMRAEIEAVVEEIQQAIALLRRHL